MTFPCTFPIATQGTWPEGVYSARVTFGKKTHEFPLMATSAAKKCVDPGGKKRNVTVDFDISLGWVVTELAVDILFTENGETVQSLEVTTSDLSKSDVFEKRISALLIRYGVPSGFYASLVSTDSGAPTTPTAPAEASATSAPPPSAGHGAGSASSGAGSGGGW